MNVTGKQFYNKLHELRPDLSSGITSEILSKTCDDPSTQPFLEWFCKNVGHINVLSNEEIQMKSTLQSADGEWLEDEALDAALEEATKDCPDLLRLVSLDDHSEDLFAECETLKESCREDEKYLQSLRQTIKNLKKVENKLDDDIEEANTTLKKEQIETEKVYDDCSVILKEFDKDNRQFSKDVNNLLNVYADAAKNQGSAVLWLQMPTDLFIKQIELYNHYLGIHIKKQFGSANNEKQDEDLDYSSLINDTREKQIDEKMNELFLCKTNLINAKIEEINANIQEESCRMMLQCVENIYSSGVPYNKMHDEILTLTTKRDILEQNVELLRDQQYPEIAQFAEMETLKILKNDAVARLERRKARLEKLKSLYILAGEHGHVHVDLLCILMEMQYRNLHQVAEFIADARHYIATEYKLSSTRCEIMQQQQDEYATLVTQSPKTCNAFNKMFISMMLGDNNLDKLLSSALKKYDDLIADNAEKELMLEAYLNNKISKLQELENEIDKDYISEIQFGPTNSFVPISYEISTGYDEIFATVQEIQTNVIRIRNQLKERMRTDINLEREKDILWQKFLADADTLRMRYEEVKQKINEFHFGDTLESKLSP